MSESTRFPRPEPHPGYRWQPLRSGLVNLFRYDDEEFVFEKGRLLLRGDNGTGKSRVLALQLPFLLDGETSSHRVEPDGDSSRRFDWHLLMGKYDDRTGYTWIEFGRLDEDGEEHFVTLGCGLKAVEGRGLTDKWFFVTSRRIGESLALVASTGIPLGREGLEKALTGNGRIFRTARDYRAAVDQELFQLGERRYEALVNLLIQLRKPQLSREFNEGFLSAALSEALAPLDPETLSVIAEAYRGLDEDRTQLEGYQAAHHAVSTFLSEYSTYAKIACRRRAHQVRTAHSAYDDAQRELRKADAELEAMRARHAEAALALSGLRVELAAGEERVRTLEASPEMRQARELEQAKTQALRCEEIERSARDAVARAGAEDERALARQEECRATSRERRGEAGKRRDAACQSADEAALELPALRESLDTPERFPACLARAEQLLDNRRKAIAELEDLERELGRLEGVAGAARRAQTQASSRCAELRETLADREKALAREIAVLKEEALAWLGSLSALRIEAGFEESVSSELEDWCRECAGPTPVESAMRAALASLRQETDQALGALGKEREELGHRRAMLEAELRQLESGRHEPPPARAGVGTELRRTAPGAPFWKTVDFLPELSLESRAGIEAALEASGILDAWVCPDGRLLSPGEHETVFSAEALSEEGLPPPEATLARWLVPALDGEDPQASGLSNGLIARLLRRITARIGEDGTWRNGSLEGRWTKPAAQHLGQGARAAERRRRIAELESQVAAARGEEEGLARKLAELEGRRALADREASALPAPARCSAALSALGLARDAAASAELALQEAERAALQAVREKEAASDECARTAEAHGLTPFRGRLRELADRTRSLERALGALGSGIARWQDALGVVALAEEARARTAENLSHATQALEEASRDAGAARVRSDTLEASIGSTVEEILRRLEEARSAARELKAGIERENEKREEASREGARLDERAANFRTALAEKTALRDAALEAMRGFAGTGLLSAALSEKPTDDRDRSVTAWIELCRRIETELGAVDSGDGVWERRSKAIFGHFTTLQTALGALTYRAEATTEGELFIARIPLQQRLCPVDEVARVFASEVEARQRILEAREREIIENHLIGEVSAHIHDRLHAAELWKDHVNRELEERPTATGMRLRFDWILDESGPASFAEVRRRLMRAAVAWSEADRQGVADFLHQRLQAERLGNPQATWFENLSAAFDYRRWHRFVVDRQQDGKWQRLTRRTFGTGSGGEKALMLTMPQFAAAAAHYRSAGAAAPRLILLDEAFVGIDNRNRVNSMGLLATFDLDLMMTSEREWGCYPTVPGIAIYQLSARAGVDAVLATRWVWDGSRRYRPEASSAGQASGQAN